MKRRWFTGLALCLSATLALAGCGSSDDSDDAATDTTLESIARPTFEAGTTMARLQSQDRVKIGIKFDQAGFGFKNPTTGTIEGFDVEISKLIAQGIYGGTKEEAAKHIDFAEAVSKNREPFISNGTVDLVVATYTINDTRKKIIDFAGPYYVAHGDIMVKSDNNSIQNVANLNGKSVCTARGSTYPTTLRTSAPQAAVTEFDTYTQCAEALRDGRVEAVTTDNVILAGIVQQNAGAFKLVNTNYTDEPYGIGMKKGDEAFRSFLNNRIDQTYANGSWKTAYESTLGRLGLATPEPPKVDRYNAAGGPATTEATSAGSTVVPTTTTATP